jgi:parvulin-like peptidyl-prolyl isomerase
MNSLLFFIIYFLSSIFILAQNEEIIIARIGNEVITAKELEFRYELSPYIPSEKNIDPDSVKYDFLYSLIAEKLWAKEAESEGILKSERFRSLFEPLEEMFARDALFKIEVENKVLLSADDINNGIKKSQLKLEAQIITTTDSVIIYDLYAQLNLNRNIDSLISKISNLTSNNFNIALGSLKDEQIEDSLYSLDINGFTSPIKSEVGWVIFRIKNKTFTPFDISEQKSVDNMKRIIRNRRIEKRYNEYLGELLSGIKINIDKEAFLLTYSNIWDKLKTKPVTNDSTKFFELSEYDFNSLLDYLGSDNLKKSLFNISKKSYTINEFLGNLTFEGFSVTTLDSMVVLNKLNQRLKKYVEQELITTEAYNRGLQLTPQVRNDLKMWQENYLAQLFYNKNLAAIKPSDIEVYNYYLNNLVNSSNIQLINVRLISIKDLDEVSNIFEELKQGTDFSQIVKSYGKTDSLVNENGETGLKPVLLLGYVGNVASELKLNEVYGPLRRNNAYTIIQVIESKNTNDSLKLSFDSIKEELKKDLSIERLNTKLKEVTSELSSKYNVKIYSNVIDKIKTSSIPMFVHRLMGFGGRIAGVPLTTPFSGWINNEVKLKLLP